MNRTVLLIEDDEVTAFLSRRVIEESQLFDELVHVTDGLQALERLVTEDFDAIILDLSLPNMDGYEFLKKYSELTAKSTLLRAPVLVNSGIDDIDDDRLSEFDCVVAFGLKPLTNELLTKAFNQLP